MWLIGVFVVVGSLVAGYFLFKRKKNGYRNYDDFDDNLFI